MSGRRDKPSSYQPQSIIRWAGSKRKLLRHFADLVPKGFSRYIEPFAGSACLYFSLQPTRARLNDINGELIHFYRSIRKTPEAIYKTAASYPRTKRQYLSLRALEPEKLEDRERAARFFYLNRLCFNGLYRTNRKGLFNVPMGKGMGAFPPLPVFTASAKILRKTELLNNDFEDALTDLSKGDFVYLDPPYFTPKGRRRNEYGNICFTTIDIPRLLNALLSIEKAGAKFLLSYSYDPVVLEHLKDYTIHNVEVRRSISGFAHKRTEAREILVTNHVKG